MLYFSNLFFILFYTANYWQKGKRMWREAKGQKGQLKVKKGNEEKRENMGKKYAKIAMKFYEEIKNKLWEKLLTDDKG